MKNQRQLYAHDAFTSPWCIRERSIHAFVRTLFDGGMCYYDYNDDVPARAPAYALEGAVAVVPLRGVMMRNPGVLVCYGAVDTDAFARLVTQAAADPAASAILLDVDSPGGSSMGVQEACMAVRAAAAVKPVIAYSGGLMCSAAYWAASPAAAVYASALSIVGSIGCYAQIVDTSKMYADSGVVVDVIRSGKQKAGNVNGAPVGDEYKANMQRMVDAIGAAFRADVKAGRTSAKNSAMEGQEFLGSDAVGAGLVDSAASYDRAVADAGALAAMRKR